MHKTEPKIVAPGYTDEEIYEWMTKKLAAINQLREVLSYRQETIDSLKKLDQEITVLSQDVTLDIVQTNWDPIHFRQNHQSDEFVISSLDNLKISGRLRLFYQV